MMILGFRMAFIARPKVLFDLLMIAACMAGLTTLCPAEATQTAPANSDLKITLSRSQCYGTCPDYEVTIFGDGRVVFEGKTWVLLTGRHEDRVAPERVIKLVRKFERAKFFQLRDKYQGQITDMSTQTLTFSVGKKTKTVIDYAGEEVGLPKSVRELQEAVDDLANSSRWVNGTIELVSWLEKNGFNFRSVDAAKLVADAAAGNGSDDLVFELLRRGAPLNSTVTAKDGYRGRETVRLTAGLSLVKSAISNGRATLLKKLIADGWVRAFGTGRASEVFAATAAGCSAELIDAMVDAGLDIDKPVLDRDVVGSAGSKYTALLLVVRNYSCHSGESDGSAFVERLLRKGANPNFKDEAGRTALFGVTTLSYLGLLLQHGADVRVRDNVGRSAAFASTDDEIVVRLLQAGVSPLGRDEECKNLLEVAKENDMTRVEQWLTGWLKKHPEIRELGVGDKTMCPPAP